MSYTTFLSHFIQGMIDSVTLIKCDKNMVYGISLVSLVWIPLFVEKYDTVFLIPCRLLSINYVAVNCPCRWVAAQSVFYHLYNQVSYMSLDEISPLTFSIGNTMKRISVIVSSIIIFHTPVQPINALGAAIAVAGTFIYSQVFPCSLSEFSVTLHSLVIAYYFKSQQYHVRHYFGPNWLIVIRTKLICLHSHFTWLYVKVAKRKTKSLSLSLKYTWATLTRLILCSLF